MAELRHIEGDKVEAANINTSGGSDFAIFKC